MRPSQFKTFNILCSTLLTGDRWFWTAYFYGLWICFLPWISLLDCQHSTRIIFFRFQDWQGWLACRNAKKDQFGFHNLLLLLLSLFFFFGGGGPPSVEEFWKTSLMVHRPLINSLRKTNIKQTWLMKQIGHSYTSRLRRWTRKTVNLWKSTTQLLSHVI